MLLFCILTLGHIIVTKGLEPPGKQLSCIPKSTPNFDTPAVYQVTPPVGLAEGPTWDGRKNVLYYVDIHAGRILSYNYETRKINSITLNGNVTPVVPSKHNENLFLVGLNRSLVAVKWDAAKGLEGQKVLCTISKQFPTSRFNDGKADKRGRLWFGTQGYIGPKGIAPNQGVLYKITKENINNPEVEIAPVNISNGLAWNKANNKFYYIDTPTRKIAEYDYNDELGTISYNRTAFDFKKHDKITGRPDGMTIDVDDNLWIALFEGGAVIKANPRTGELLQMIPIPALYVTSAMWGGPDLDILFVTTSRYTLTKEQRKSQPGAGSVFAVTNLGTKGLPMFGADIIDSF